MCSSDLALQFVYSVTAAFGACVEVVGGVFVTAVHTAVTVVVDATIAHIVFVHKVYDVGYGFGVVGGVAVNLDIEYVSAACQFVVRCLDLGLVARRAVVVYRNVVGVCVIDLISNSGDDAEGFAVFGGELAGQAFGRGGEYREVVLILFAVLIGAASHMRYDTQTQFLRFLIFAVMVSGECDKTFGQTDESDAEGSVVDNGFDGVRGT